MTIGATKFPSNSPILIQQLFSGVKILEFIKPKIKKINDKNKNFISMIFPLKVGQKDIIKNTKKNKKPKLLFEPLFFMLSNSITKI